MRGVGGEEKLLTRPRLGEIGENLSEQWEEIEQRWKRHRRKHAILLLHHGGEELPLTEMS